MLLPDVNVVLYAARTDAVNHQKYYQWLDNAFASNQVVLADIVIAGFVRILTNRKAFPLPTPIETAFSHIENLIAQPSCVRLQPAEHHWSIFKDLCKSADVKAAMVTDAWLAAIAIEHGCELITTDRDFARFKGLKWRHPLD